MKKLLPFVFFTFFVFSLTSAQNSSYWTRSNFENVAQLSKTDRVSMPKTFEIFSLNFNILQSKLEVAPLRENYKTQNGIEISFPNPNGTFSRYSVYKAQIMHPELAARYSEIVSYVGIGIDDPTATIRFSTTIFGLHTMTFSGNNNTSIIDPFTSDLNNYIVYFKNQVVSNSSFSCDTKEDGLEFRSFNPNDLNEVQANNGIFRKYRLAISSTVEYSNFHIAQAGLASASVSVRRAAVLAAMVVSMTRVNGLFERDLAITMELIPNNDILISIGSDNFNNFSASALLTENQNAVTNAIGSSGFDIGHIFSTGGGGVAILGCVCIDNIKARGVTGSNSPVNDPFNIDFVAHEMGHQFGATHTFNSGNAGNCTTGTRTNSTAVEPGSGSTIMAYAGICSPEDVQGNSDDHFHAVSMAQIDALVASSANCSLNTPSNNSAPVIQSLRNFTIPIGTPFVLTGNATDANNPNTLTYCWEQTNTTINAIQPTDPSNLGPNFRSFTPTSSPLRYFPKLADVVNNNPSIWEVLPSVARTMNFALTVRDNSTAALGGQTNRANMTVTTAGTTPFTVLSPNTAVSWAAGSNQNVTWDVAGTIANGINTAFVDIYLSTNGGNSFPVLLASKVPNDGSETILVPNSVSSNNRIMVMGNNNIFYDVSDLNFNITTAPSTQGIAFNGIAGNQNKLSCGNASVSFAFNYATFAGFSGLTTFSVTGNPGGSTAVFSPTSTSASGAVTLTLNNIGSAPIGLYTLVVTATSGVITKTLNLYLQVNAGTPNTTLVSPANLANITPSNINLNWTNNPGITEYVVQIAPTNAFSSFIVNTTVATNSFTFPNSLNGTDYFWRIASKNGECTGGFSAPFKFTTSFCINRASTNIPIIISDELPSTIESNLTVANASNVLIDNVDVSVNISHAYMRDITVSLISPAGTIVQLYARQCPNSASFQNAIATFDDAATVSIACVATPPSLSGRIIPFQALSAFNGQSLQGVWKLRIVDAADGDGGILNSWNLDICSSQGPLGTTTFQNSVFSVYPNPNNGNFNIKMDNLISDKVGVSVYDLRGRLVFNKDFKAVSNFNQNIQLDAIQSGVYLLNVIDGDRKETKRIVIQ